MRWVWRCVLVAAASALAPWLSRPVLGENLLGQVAVVTGGGRGLGRGIAQALGEAGATVFITGRTEAPLLESCRLISPPGRCIPKIVDSANDSSLEEFFAGVSRETNGELDILVNNAYSAVGYWGKNRLLGKPFWEAPMQLFDAVFDVGVRSHYKATVLAVPMMQKRGRGLIVNSNSPGCVMYAINVAYGMGKCAIDKMSSDMAMELATEGIDVISYWPGVLQTEEILAGSIDLVAQPAANGNVGQAPAPSLSRRGVSPGLAGICPPFSSLYYTALAETLLFAGRGVSHFARDQARSKSSGLALVSSQLASYYDFVDERGVRSPSALVSIKGILTMLLPPMRNFAALPVGGEASPMQRWYFNALPDVYIPLSLLKAIGGPPLTMQWPVPEW